MPAPKGHPPYPGCETGGRPQKYTKELLDNLADKLTEWMAIDKNLWLNNFFTDNYMPVDGIDTYCNRSEKFSLAYKHAKTVQESKIFVRALERRYDGTMARFGLMNNHGWAEKSKTEISGNANNPLNVLFNHSKELVGEKAHEEPNISSQ